MPFELSAPSSVTVLLPVYREPVAFIRRSLHSILKQDFRRLSIRCVVDDPENTQTIAYLRTMAKKYPRLFLQVNHRNLGIGASLNRAISGSDSTFLARMDADDIAMPGRISAQVSYLEQHPDIFLVGTGMIHMHRHKYDRSRWVIPETDPDIIERILEERNCLSHPTIMFRASPELYYDESRSHIEDYIFYKTALERGLRLGNIKRPYLYYRKHESSISATFRDLQQSNLRAYISSRTWRGSPPSGNRGLKWQWRKKRIVGAFERTRCGRQVLAILCFIRYFIREILFP